MREKVVLYNPRAVFYTMPLGLLAVGSALDPARYDVRIVDGRLERDPAGAVLREIDDALCLGIGVLSGAPIADALAVSRAARARRPALPIVWGGWHPSLFPAETLAEPCIDVTVQGQGEATFAAVVERLTAGEPPAGVAGATYRHAGQVVQQPAGPLADPNTFRAHDHDLLPVERYFAGKGKRQLDYVSSAGCLYRCAFCADPLVYGRRWAGLEPARVGAELERWWRRYEFTDVSFQDESLFTSAGRVVAMAEEFLRRRLGFTWTGTLRADQAVRLPEEALATCRRAGLRQVMIGVESGSPAILDRIRKDVTVEQVLEACAKCLRHRLQVTAPFIVGFPDESDADVQRTLDLVKRLRAMSPRLDTPIFYYQPYPGSDLAGAAMPATLDEWARFDFVGAAGAWVSPARREQIERFKFYNRFAWGREALWRRPLQLAARWRCRHDFYALPLEKAIVERLRPAAPLS